MLGSPGKTGVPYIGGHPNPQPVGPVYNPNFGGGKPPSPQPQPIGPISRTITTGPASPTPGASLPAESVRATGNGPFDAAYRQDLATYAGGLFNRPGGNLSFNPTSNQPFGGQATGGGNAPVLGMPNTLLQNALAGNPFTFTPPLPASSSGTQSQPNAQQLQDWLTQFLGQGRNQRLAMV